MANRKNLEQAIEYAVAGFCLEKLKADGLITAQDGIIKAEADIKEMEACIAECNREILAEYGTILDNILDPQFYTILAESLTAEELREAEVAEDMIQLFTTADTNGRQTVLDLLEPSVILPLCASKYREVVAQIRERETEASVPIVDRIRAELIQQIRTATPDSLQGSRGLLRANMDILEQAIRREAKENSGDELRLVFKHEGEYPDGTKWERDATPDEEAEYKRWAE